MVDTYSEWGGDGSFDVQHSQFEVLRGLPWCVNDFYVLKVEDI